MDSGKPHFTCSGGASGLVSKSFHNGFRYVGIGGMAGAVGGMLIAKVVGYILDATGSYVPIFIIAGSAYLFALLLFHSLTPKMNPVAIE